VSVGIVDGLEMIESMKISENSKRSDGAVDLRIEHEIQVTRVVQAGANRRDGELVDALHVARVSMAMARSPPELRARQIALLKTPSGRRS